jgi:hypothetical protein
MHPETAAFAVFTVTLSTPDDKLLSSDATVTITVNIIPNTQIVVEFINLDNLLICTLSDIFETIAKATEINENGMIIFVIALLTNVIINNIIG